MKNHKGDRTLLGASVAFVAVLVLGGIWASKQNADTAAKVGRYRLVSTTPNRPAQEIELKEDGQWSGFRVKGTYSIAGDEVTFSGKDSPPFTGRFTGDAFAINTTTPNASKRHYKKISQ